MSQGGGALRAVQDAIQMYMGLRQDKYDRGREQEADSRAGRQLALAEQRAQLEQDETQRAADEKQIQFQVTNYGGSPVEEADASMWRKRGYGSALETEQTLPAHTLQMPTSPTGGSGGQMASQQMPSQDSGRTLIRQPESEKMRIAYYQALTRGQEGDKNRASREGIARGQMETARARIEAQLRMADASLVMRQYGIDVNDATRRAQLAELLAWREVQTGNMNTDNMFSGGPLGMMRFMGPDGLQIPNPQPLYYNPQRPPAGGAGVTPPGQTPNRRYIPEP